MALQPDMNRRELLGLAGCLLLTPLDSNSFPSAHTGPGLIDGQWLIVRIQCIVCADDDGNRRCDANYADIQRMIAVANRIYEQASVRFVCDIDDYIEIKSTLLNSQDDKGAGSRVDLDLRTYELAHRYAGKVIVFSRYGPAREAIGNGYSGGGMTAVVLPSLRHTNAGLRMLAHELGHFFGLPHTFKEQFHTLKAASDKLAKNGNNLDEFDGDGFSDTAPDPGLDLPFNKPVKEIVINGVSVPLPYGNIMSYMNWDGNDWMSVQQAKEVREYIGIRASVGMSWQSNMFALNPMQAERMMPVYTGGCIGQVQPMAGYGKHRWSGDDQLFCHSPIGGSVTLSFQTNTEIDADIGVYMTLAIDYGIVRFSLDGKQIGRTFDAYCPYVVPSGRLALGKLMLGSGNHLFKIEVVGRNSSSKGTQIGIDCLSLRSEDGVSPV